MATKPSLFAADTNFLIDLEAGTQSASEGLEVIRARVPGVVICVPPTVIDELAWGAENWTGIKQGYALNSLLNLKSKWDFQPIDFISVGYDIVEINAANILDANLLPIDQRNDALILSEAALLVCSILITTDQHLLEIDKQKLRELLVQQDLGIVLIQSPRDIVRTFGGKIRRT